MDLSSDKIGFKKPELDYSIFPPDFYSKEYNDPTLSGIEPELVHPEESGEAPKKSRPRATAKPAESSKTQSQSSKESVSKDSKSKTNGKDVSSLEARQSKMKNGKQKDVIKKGKKSKQIGSSDEDVMNDESNSQTKDTKSNKDGKGATKKSSPKMNNDSKSQKKSLVEVKKSGPSKKKEAKSASDKKKTTTKPKVTKKEAKKSAPKESESDSGDSEEEEEEEEEENRDQKKGNNPSQNVMNEENSAEPDDDDVEEKSKQNGPHKNLDTSEFYSAFRSSVMDGKTYIMLFLPSISITVKTKLITIRHLGIGINPKARCIRFVYYMDGKRKVIDGPIWKQWNIRFLIPDLIEHIEGMYEDILTRFGTMGTDIAQIVHEILMGLEGDESAKQFDSVTKPVKNGGTYVMMDYSKINWDRIIRSTPKDDGIQSESVEKEIETEEETEDEPDREIESSPRSDHNTHALTESGTTMQQELLENEREEEEPIVEELEEEPIIEKYSPPEPPITIQHEKHSSMSDSRKRSAEDKTNSSEANKKSKTMERDLDDFNDSLDIAKFKFELALKRLKEEAASSSSKLEEMSKDPTYVEKTIERYLKK